MIPTSIRQNLIPPQRPRRLGSIENQLLQVKAHRLNVKRYYQAVNWKVEDDSLKP
jgi:hypothetical protein